MLDGNDVRVPAHWAEPCPISFGDVLLRSVRWDVTCGYCRGMFVKRAWFWMGVLVPWLYGRRSVPPTFGVRCPHCDAFNLLSSAPR